MRKKIAKTPEQALNSLMALCAGAEKSSGDALRLMSQWEVEQSSRKGVLDKLLQTKFIDDRRYAAAYVRDKSRLSGWGFYKIRNGLQLKGVSTSIIDEQLDTLDKKSCEERLNSIIKKKLDSLTESDTYKLKAKLVRYALGLGYEYESVISAVEKRVQNDDFI